MAQPTPEQLAAAHAGPEGAFLIAAGPGTGKTFTMVERFTWLVRECRVPCDGILTVTFTERAAAELKERIAGELRPAASPAAAADLAAMESAWIGTFHGICARLLRENAYLVGAPKELRVLDEVGQPLFKESVQAAIRGGAAGVDLDALTALGPEDVAELLRYGLDFALKLKGRGIGAGEFRERALELHAERLREAPDARPDSPPARAEEEAVGILFAVYSTYQDALAAGGLLDFDDLILRTIAALEDVPEFQARCRERFRQIVVDEFQDTNEIQLRLISLLAADGLRNVSVVGDAKQSIYGWRDAEIENIRSRFPGSALPLTVNRRSHQEILDCATSLIRRDPDFRGEPDLVAARGSGGTAVTVMMAPDPAREARMVAEQVNRLRRQGLAPEEIAILARSVRRLPPEFEQELRRHGIPYVTSGGSGFFDREEVKDVVALLRLAEDPLADGPLVRVLQGPLVRLGDAGMYRLAARRFGRRGMRLRDCWRESEAEAHPDLDPGVAGRASRVLAAVDAVAEARDSLSVAGLLGRLLEETGYLRHARLRATREGPRGLLNLRHVVSMASRFEARSPLAGIADLVRHLDQVMAADLPVAPAPDRSEAVSLLTVHAAKGLEWRAVFLVNTRPAVVRDFERYFFDPGQAGFVMKRWSGARDGRHPRFGLTSPSAPQLGLARAEGRRVVYVALTRAADRLWVSASREEASVDEVARGELEDDYFAEILAWALANPAAARIVESEQLDLPEPASEPVPEGGDGVTVLATVVGRLERLAAAPRPAPAGPEGRVRLSFSQLAQFELCPVRYRYQEVWRVPAPPDELLAPAARPGGASALGSAIHDALRAFHTPLGGPGGRDLLAAFAELAGRLDLPPAAQEAGADMLGRYLEHPLAAAATLGTEVEFNLLLGSARVRGLVDRIASDPAGTTLIDYKSNRHLDAAQLATYSTQLRLYGLAAARGLLPGGPEPRLALFDLRQGRVVTVEPDPEGVAEEVARAAAAIEAGRFELGPSHEQRPCFLCAYRPVCPSRRP